MQKFITWQKKPRLCTGKYGFLGGKNISPPQGISDKKNVRVRRVNPISADEGEGVLLYTLPSKRPDFRAFSKAISNTNLTRLIT